MHTKLISFLSNVKVTSVNVVLFDSPRQGGMRVGYRLEVSSSGLTSVSTLSELFDLPLTPLTPLMKERQQGASHGLW